jgi:monoamine oxidase
MLNLIFKLHRKNGLTIDTIGISGMSAARLLQDKGYSVTVIEGRSRLGGRMFTDRSSIYIYIYSTYIYLYILF